MSLTLYELSPLLEPKVNWPKYSLRVHPTPHLLARAFLNKQLDDVDALISLTRSSKHLCLLDGEILLSWNKMYPVEVPSFLNRKATLAIQVASPRSSAKIWKWAKDRRRAQASRYRGEIGPGEAVEYLLGRCRGGSVARAALIVLAQSDDPMKGSQIARTLGRKSQTIYAYLQWLEEGGLVSRKGSLWQLRDPRFAEGLLGGDGPEPERGGIWSPEWD